MCLCVLSACMSVLHACLMPAETRRGHKIPWIQMAVSLHVVLGIELGSCERAASLLTSEPSLQYSPSFISLFVI